MTLAICCCVLLGTVGWFAVGFGLMTDCTSSYSCSSGGCSPCAGAGRWINGGGIAQWLLAALGVWLLVRDVRTPRGSRLLLGAVAVVVVSAGTAGLTSWRASVAYCQPGTTDYPSSYCAVGL